MYMFGKMLDRNEGARGLANFSIATYTIFSGHHSNQHKIAVLRIKNLKLGRPTISFVLFQSLVILA